MCVSVTSQRLENWKNRLYIILTTQVWSDRYDVKTNIGGATPINFISGIFQFFLAQETKDKVGSQPRFINKSRVKISVDIIGCDSKLVCLVSILIINISVLLYGLVYSVLKRVLLLIQNMLCDYKCLNSVLIKKHICILNMGCVVCIYNFARDVSISRWVFFITYNLPELVLIIFPALVYNILYSVKFYATSKTRLKRGHFTCWHSVTHFKFCKVTRPTTIFHCCEEFCIRLTDQSVLASDRTDCKACQLEFYTWMSKCWVWLVPGEQLP